MTPEQREQVTRRWEEVLYALAEIDHLKVSDGDPTIREDQLLAELAELEFELTLDDRRSGPSAEQC